MFSSAIEVIHQTPSRLTVVDPPYYLLGGFFAVAGLVWIVGCLILVNRSGTPMKYGVVFTLMGAPFLILGLILLTSRTSSVLSRDANVMTVDSRCLGIRLQHHQVPLTAVRRAAVEAGRGRLLIVLLDSGAPITLAGRTDRNGYYEAANAINEFMKRQPTP
jgi:hypothetical protein